MDKKVRTAYIYLLTKRSSALPNNIEYRIKYLKGSKSDNYGTYYNNRQLIYPPTTHIVTKYSIE